MGRARAHASDAKAPPTAQTRVAGYIRVSTDKQKASGLGLADQERKIRAMRELKGWGEPMLFTDEGVSGAKEGKDRPGLRDLLAAVERGEIDVIVINSLDRLARKARLTLEVVHLLKVHGVALISCKETIDTSTPSGQLFMTVLAAMAEFERELARERTRNALAQLALKTGLAGGRVPYGYVRSAGGVDVDPETSKIVKRIFAWRRRGVSLRDIAAKLNAEGVPAPRSGGKWRHTSVVEILAHRAVYRGARRGPSELRWPAILTAA
jgi:site-specific DNA recombinase